MCPLRYYTVLQRESRGPCRQQRLIRIDPASSFARRDREHVDDRQEAAQCFGPPFRGFHALETARLPRSSTVTAKRHSPPH